MPVEYASLNDAKDYLEIPREVTQYDNKLTLILNGINFLCEKYTGETETDAMLKLSVCKFIENNWNKTTGTKSESDKDVKMTFTEEDIPPDVKSIWNRYVDEDDEGGAGGGVTIENI